MGYEPFYITNYEQDSGQDNYFENFLLPEKAFPVLQDAFCWRGRVRRRFGTKKIGRLRAQLQNFDLLPTDGGNYANADILFTGAINIRVCIPPIISETYAEIEPSTSIVAPPAPPVVLTTLTITIGSGADNTVYSDSDGAGVVHPGVLECLSGPYIINAGSINYATGEVTLNFAVTPANATPVVASFYYFPALPCMGLRTYELPLQNIKKTIAFDQKYAYEYDPATQGFIELVSVPPVTWTGSDSLLFWTINYATNGNGNLFWATNNNVGAIAGGVYVPREPIRYYDSASWTDFIPVVDGAGTILAQAQCILPFKGRLLVFNTWEVTVGAVLTNYYNRVRWSWVGVPFDQVNGWLSTPGAGGFLDAPINEAIVSVEYLKDVILVKFVNSSWKLVYTGNQIIPFIFQKIDTSMGSISTFSMVPFDEEVLSISNLGITEDDSSELERIDIKIPDYVFKIYPSLERPHGIRDFVNELVYWSYTDVANWDPLNAAIFNNQVLVYNYRNESFAKFSDSFTCYGRLDIPGLVTAYTYRLVAGNQQGFVVALNQASVQASIAAPLVTNAPSLAITAITAGNPMILTVPNHNFSALSRYWVRLDGIIGIDELNFNITPNIYFVVNTGNPNTIILATWSIANQVFTPFTLTLYPGEGYLGGGTLTIIQNFNISTKVFAPFYEEGKQGRLGYIDFLFNRTVFGECSCDLYVNENPNPVNDPITQAGLLGTNVILTRPENLQLIPYEGNQAKIWHRFFSQSIAENFQLTLTMNEDQMSQYDVATEDFVMHAMTLYLSPTARMTE